MISTSREILEQLFSGKSAELKTRFIRGAAGSFGLKIVFSASSLLLNILLSRALGADGYGAYSYAFAWVTLLGVPAILGMDQLLIREVAAYQVQHAWGKFRGLLRNANRAVLMSSAILGCAAFLVSWLLRGSMDPAARISFWIALPLLPVMALTRIRQSVLQGLQRVTVSGLPESLIQPVLMIALVSGAWWMSGSLTAPGTMAIRVFANVAGLAIGAVMVLRLLPREVRHAPPEFSGFAWMHSILPLVLFASVSVVYGQADILVLGALKGSSVVGRYAVADRSAELINFLMVAVNSALAPAVADIHARRDSRRLQAATLRVVRTAFLLALPIGLVLIFLGYWWLRLLYGAAYTEASLPLAILSAGQLLSVAAGPSGLLLLMTSHEKRATRWILVSAILHIGLCAALIPHWGAEGAAVAAATSNVVCNVFLAASVRRLLGVDPTILGRTPAL